ncbi:MAG: sigma-70 family RNA polymerase sigma factor [Oscillospiraceae bacterium]|nr:sigma-70 family RNA polymerase sigma factor [Oscillospiraceae bacterium]
MAPEINSLSDNGLIEIVRRNRNDKQGKEAVSELISRYIRLILKRANTYSDNYSDVEDLTQDGMLAFYEAVDSFDLSRGTKFSSYADVCVSNRIKTAAAKLAAINSRLSDIDSEDDDIRVTEASPESICLEKENFRSINREITAILAPLEVKVFRFYLDGASYKEIAEKLDITEKSVDNAVFRIRKKLKKFLSV